MAHNGLLVGLTGGIGTGKTRVADLLASLGAAVECSDKLVRELQARGGAVLRAIANTFGPEYLLPDGELDRAKLGKKVFADAQARMRLNALVHPLVTAELQRRVAAHRAAGTAVIVVDIPLLLEGKKAGVGTGAVLPFDVIAVVYSSPDQQLARVTARDALSPDDARARIAAQLPIDEKRALADVVIDNTGDWEATAKQVRELYALWARRG